MKKRFQIPYQGNLQVANNDPGVTVTNMTTNLILKIDQSDLSIWAKIAGLTPAVGSCYLNGIKATVTSKAFVKIYPS